MKLNNLNGLKIYESVDALRLDLSKLAERLRSKIVLFEDVSPNVDPNANPLPSDIPWGIIGNGELKYVDSPMLVDDAKQKLGHDFKNNETNLNHALMSIILFGEESITPENLNSLWVVRGRTKEKGDMVALWHTWDEILDSEKRTKALKIAMATLLRDRNYGVHEDTRIVAYHDPRGTTVKAILEA